jgi:uncharacterized membrane-anchored protein
MKLNRLACSFLCLLLISGLQGCDQKKDVTFADKTPVVATTNAILSEFAQLKADAEKGNASSQYRLGSDYEFGMGVA